MINFDLIKKTTQKVIKTSYELKDLLSKTFNYDFIEQYYFEERNHTIKKNPDYRFRTINKILLKLKKKKKRIKNRKRLRIIKKRKPRILKRAGQVSHYQFNVVANDLTITHFNGLKTAFTLLSNIFKYLRSQIKVFALSTYKLLYKHLLDFFPKTENFQILMGADLPYLNLHLQVVPRRSGYKIRSFVKYFKKLFKILKESLKPFATYHMLKFRTALTVRGSKFSLKGYVEFGKTKQHVLSFGFNHKFPKLVKRRKRYYKRRGKSSISHLQFSRIFTKRRLLRKKPKRLISKVTYYKKRKLTNYKKKNKNIKKYKQRLRKNFKGNSSNSFNIASKKHKLMKILHTLKKKKYKING